MPAGFGPSVVAIGKFDGVHAGHRAVLERARVDAATGGARVVAVTFDRNPLSVLRPELCPEDLIGVTQKLQLLAETGIDATLVLRFDEQLASLPAREFVEQILVDALGARTVLVGLDFRFGKGGTGNPDLLRELGAELGFRVDVVDDVRSIDTDRRVSSTWIRELLAEGEVESAAKLLGRPPRCGARSCTGTSAAASSDSRPPTSRPNSRASSPRTASTPAGSSTRARRAGCAPASDSPPRSASGSNPTFDDVTERQVEAYVLDETDLDLYGHRVEVQFVARVRGMVAFEGVPALVEQIADDVVTVRRLLA